MFSVIIPVKNGLENLNKILKRMEEQSLSPCEVIIIDSSDNNNVEDVIKRFNLKIPLIFKKIDFAYPGRARNIGVDLATSKWVAFLDLHTIPTKDWLRNSQSIIVDTDADYILGSTISNATTEFSMLIKAATYGNKKITTVPGTIIKKEIFYKTKKFMGNVRSGEDRMWIYNLNRMGFRKGFFSSATTMYDGFPKRLKSSLLKWFEYSASSAKVDLRKKIKLLYFSALFFCILYLVYAWNGSFLGWEEKSVLYISTVTKFFLLFNVISYTFLRGLIKPLLLNERVSFILPYRWIKIATLGFLLDIFQMLGTYISLFHFKKNKL